MVYAVLVERLERDVRSERQIIAMLAANGAQGLEVPDFATALEELNAALGAAPRVADTEREELLMALGLR